MLFFQLASEIDSELAGRAYFCACLKMALVQLSLDYSSGQINFEVRPMNRMLMAEECCAPVMDGAGSYDMDIEPDDIEVSDTVTVLWEIG